MMKMKMNNTLYQKMALLLAVLLLLGQMLGSVALAADADSRPGADSGPSADVLESAIADAAAHLLKADMLSDWAAFGVAKAGGVVPDAYLAAARAAVEENGGVFGKVTDAQRLVLALGALGVTPRDFAGVDLIEAIVNHERMENQGPNGPIYTLIVLGGGSYELADGAVWTPDALVAKVLEAQHADGSWSLFGPSGNADMTAMALTALAFYDAEPGAAEAAQRGFDWLAKAQLDNGGFSDSGDNAESAAQVVVALSSHGRDAAAFAKNGNSVLAHLLSFRNSDGGFAHLPGQPSNGMATEQALLGLLAYQAYVGQQGSVFAAGQAVAAEPAAVEVRIEGPDAALAQAAASGRTALEALQAAAAASGLEVKLTETSFGQYVSAIGGVAEQLLGGFDGWSFNVKRDGQWQFPQVGMADYVLADGDELVIYYTDYSTQMVESVAVEPHAPKAGEPFAVRVVKSSYDWEAGTVATAPAVGVKVAAGAGAGALSAVTDDTGVASFSGGLEEGRQALVVSGYADGAAPAVVRHTATIDVLPAGVDAAVRVEGSQGQILVSGSVGETAYDALTFALETSNIPYSVEQYSFGVMVEEIAGEKAGTFGGWDGWYFAVKRGGSWVEPLVGADAFELERGDEVVFYYSNMTQLVHNVSTEPYPLRAGEPFAVEARLADGPAAGVRVDVGGLSAVTGEDGVARFAEGLPNGKHTLVVSGYREGDAPGVLRAETDIVLYGDAASISGWAAGAVQKAYEYGFMSGVDAAAARFEPQRAITRAEYAALLMRMLKVSAPVPAEAPFEDVATGMYAGVAAKAKQLGIVDASAKLFRPNDALTRVEMAVMTARALQLQSGQQLTFADADDISAAARPYVSALLEAGIMVGDGDKFRPSDVVTREAAAAVAVRSYER